MRRDAVSWRMVLVALALLGVVVGSTVLIVRSQGFDAVDADATRATRWFVDKSTDRIVLVDGYGGRALARLQPGDDTVVDEVVQGGGQATVLDRATQTTRYIDGAGLKLGPSQPLPVLGDSGSIVGIGVNGVVAVAPEQGAAMIVPPGGTPIRVDLVADSNRTKTRIAPDGSIWTLTGGELRRTSATESDAVLDGLNQADFSLVGDIPLVVDRERSRWRLGDGAWENAPDGVQIDDLALQEASPRASCGWVGVDDTLLCIGPRGVERRDVIDGLDVDGGDKIAISGDVAVVVDQSTGQINRLDLDQGAIIETEQATSADVLGLRVATSVDLVWVDDPNGGSVWAINPWGMRRVQKDDASIPLIGEDGDAISGGQDTGTGGGGVAGVDGEYVENQPDGDANDDPPVAVDDSVSARTGVSVPINVTANDYDPDGEAIVLVAAGAPSNGSTTVSSATTVTYQPSVGFTGTDKFEYTIVDGNGTEATATVTIELLSPDSPNQAPVGTPDVAQTGPQKSVTIDVLLNDVDPERDALRISTFAADVSAGSVREVTAPSGLPGLQFSPAEGFFGEATLTYTPMDALGAIGTSVDVVVEVASPGTENRPPVTKPDSIRVRRGVPSQLAVLANDSDPDGDDLRLELIEPLPESLTVTISGDALEITAGAGSNTLNPIRYRAVDAGGLDAEGSVLVSVVDDAEPNRPPIANADTATAVADKTTRIDVLANDSDPDGDPLRLVSATAYNNVGTVTVDGDQLSYQADPLSDSTPVLDRLEYTVSDGQGNEVEGSVSVRIIPESLPEPPIALDDSVTTELDTAIVIDVLANDRDPSGESLAIVGKPGCATGGEATVTSSQLVRFTPPPKRPGVFNCSYEVSNSSGLRSVATITISVVSPTATNRPPVIISEERAVRVGQSVTVAVLANDSDPDGDAKDLRLLNSTNPTSGTAIRNSDGTITYNAPDTATVVSISYDVIDSGGAIASGRLVIRVIGETPQPPKTAGDLRILEAPVAEVMVDVLANDSDPDGSTDALRLTQVRMLSGSGSAAIVGRQVRVVPAAGFLGELLVEYTVADVDDLTATGVITIRITATVNRSPVANPDNASVAAGETIVVPIGLNDLDPDGDPMTFRLTEGPPAGVGNASVANGQLTFSAAADANGEVKMRYEVSDGKSSASTTVTVTVVGCASAAPVAKDAFLETGYQQPIPIDLFKYADNGRVTDVSGAITEPVATYTPPPGENGNVTVSYAVVNACGDRDTGTITIDVNQDPVGSQFEISLARNSPIRVAVDQIASDDEPLVISSLVNAPDWVRVISGRKVLEFAPGAVTGRVNFSVVVTDTGGLSSTVPIVATVENQAPVAQEQTLYADRVDYEFTLMGAVSDPDGDAVSYLSLPTTVTFNGKAVPLRKLANNRLRLDLANIEGNATFTYTVQDTFGLSSRQTIAKIETRWVDPVAEDVTARLTAGTSVTVRPNVSDVDGQALQLSAAELRPDDGLPFEIEPGLTVAFKKLEIVVAAGPSVAAGTYSLQYRVTDTGGRSDVAQLRIEVKAATTPPTSPDSTTSTTRPT